MGILWGQTQSPPTRTDNRHYPKQNQSIIRQKTTPSPHTAQPSKVYQPSYKAQPYNYPKQPPIPPKQPPIKFDKPYTAQAAPSYYQPSKVYQPSYKAQPYNYPKQPPIPPKQPPIKFDKPYTAQAAPSYLSASEGLPSYKAQLFNYKKDNFKQRKQPQYLPIFRKTNLPGSSIILKQAQRSRSFYQQPPKQPPQQPPIKLDKQIYQKYKKDALGQILSILQADFFEARNLRVCKQTYRDIKQLQQTLLPLIVTEEYQTVKDQQEIQQLEFFKVQLNRSKGQSISITIRDPKDKLQLSYKLLGGGYICSITVQQQKYYCLLQLQLLKNQQKFNLTFLGQQQFGSLSVQLRLLDLFVSYQRRYVATKMLKNSMILPFILKPQERVFQQTKGGSFQLMGLNQFQKEVVQQSLQLEKGVLLIQGPPGTGKTTTICKLIQNYCIRRQSILVAAGSNQAVNNIALKFIRQHKKYHDRVIRFGIVTQKELLPFGFSHQVEMLIMKRSKITVDEVSQQELKLYFKDNFTNSEKVQSWRKNTLASAFVDSCVTRFQNLLTYDRQNRQHYKFLLRRLKQVRLFNAWVNKQFFKHSSKQQVYAQLLRNKQIVFATTVSSGQPIIIQNYFQKFEAVVIDQSAQIVDPDLYISLMTNAPRLILVGDQKQLEPTVISKAVASKGYDYTYFEKFINLKADSFFQLRIQFRMHPDISLFPNQYFYDGRLKDHPKPSKFNFFRQKAVFVDVKGKQSFQRGSAYNINQVQLVKKIVNKLLAFGAQVGVISGYKSQVKKLKNQIYEDTSLIERVKISTVDGFQGNERQVIVVSCVRSNHAGNIGFLGNERRMNVALTRAQQQLILVGNGDCLRLKDKMWDQLISHFERRGAVLTQKALSFTSSKPSFQ